MSDHDQVCQDALDLITIHGTPTAAAAASGIPRKTLADRYARALQKGMVAMSKPAAVHDREPVAATPKPEPKVVLAAERKAAKAVADKNDVSEKLKVSEEENQKLQAQLELLRGIEAGQGSRTIRIDEPITTGGQGIFCGVLSDLHVEESVTRDSIPGFDNEFNLEIAEARMKKVFQSYVFMLNNWRHIGTCDTAVLAILGDVLTNGIWEDAAETNHLGPTKAVLFAQELISAGIEYILSHGDLDHLVLPMCSGNHDRMVKKPRQNTMMEHSLSYLMYKTLQREWRAERRLDFRIAEGAHLYTDLYNTRVRWLHGDQIAYGSGVGGITIPIRKRLAAWNASNPNPADLSVMGHFHQLIDGGDFIVNGSLIGFNAFALSIGASAEPPQQACFWIDSERGKTMCGRLYVD
jgi:hypothetical protein